MALGLAGLASNLTASQNVGRERLVFRTAQHGQRGRPAASATINLVRIVAIEFGTWRCVLTGRSSGSVTSGNGKFFESSGGTKS